MKLLLANQPAAGKRRVFFFCVDATDGITPETGEAGGQPQISTDGAAWTAVGISVLTAQGNGYYYAELTQAAVLTAGTVIGTRYKSAATAEAPGTTVQVVAFDPDDVASLGLSRVNAIPTNPLIANDARLNYLDATIGSRASAVAVRGLVQGGLVQQNIPASDGTRNLYTYAVGVPTTTVIELEAYDAGQLSIVPDFYKGFVLSCTQSSTPAFGQYRRIASSAGSLTTPGNVVVTLETALTTAPGQWDDVFMLLDVAPSVPTAAAVADAVWDEATADHVAPGSMGLAQVLGPDEAPRPPVGGAAREVP